MGKWGKRYLWGCAGLGAGLVAWLGYQYYQWSVVRWDEQERNTS